jgi:hypothetical protein
MIILLLAFSLSKERFISNFRTGGDIFRKLDVIFKVIFIVNKNGNMQLEQSGPV